MKQSVPPSFSGRAQRRDGRATRGVILEAAGRIFAERGFSDATSKEICEKAGVNSASVNYYFGGKDKLYEEVLREAHQQMLSLDDLVEIIDSGVPPEEKLRLFLGRLLHTAASSAEIWGIKVFMRELAAPSQLATRAISSVVFPKAERIRELVHAITGLPPESETVQRAIAFVVLPCISLIMFPDSLRTRILPGTASNNENMLEDLTCYALGGLRALGAKREE